MHQRAVTLLFIQTVQKCRNGSIPSSAGVLLFPAGTRRTSTLSSSMSWKDTTSSGRKPAFCRIAHGMVILLSLPMIRKIFIPGTPHSSSHRDSTGCRRMPPRPLPE